MNIRELSRFLSTLTKGIKVVFGRDELADLFPSPGPTVFDHVAKERAKHFAKACGCTFSFDEETGTGTFTSGDASL
jgi:hypothetical protein